MKDRNGYIPSIIQSDTDTCYFWPSDYCTGHLERHEIFGGAYRQKSKAYGLWVTLCGCTCHRGMNGVHGNAERMNILRAEAQKKAMDYYGWTVDDFRREFGKNYLQEDL